MNGAARDLGMYEQLRLRLRVFVEAQEERGWPGLTIQGVGSLAIRRSQAKRHVQDMFKCVGCGRVLRLNATVLTGWYARGSVRDEWPYECSRWDGDRLVCAGPGFEDCEARQVEKVLERE